MSEPFTPITVTIEGARAMSGLGRTKIYECIANKSLETVRIGRRTLVKVSSLKRLLEAA
jgi:excisionase family DNA binding protein